MNAREELLVALSDIDPKLIRYVTPLLSGRPRVTGGRIMKKSIKWTRKLIGAAAAAVIVLGLIFLPGLWQGNIPLPNSTVSEHPKAVPENSTSSPDTVSSKTVEQMPVSLPELPEKDADGPVRVCVDQSRADAFRQLTECLEPDESGAVPKYEWDTLPEEEGRAEKLESLRVELMSGGGPDLFLVTNLGLGDSIFPFPEKTMKSDMLYPMDKLLEQSRYFEAAELNQTVLAAGRSEKGQMLLPLTYTWAAASFQEAPEELHSWQEISECTDPEVRSRFGALLYCFFFSMGELADYEEEKLLFSEEELAKHMREARDLLADAGEAPAAGGMIDPLVTPRAKVTRPLYNTQGGVTARVSTYAAINRNSEHILGSFSLLDLLLSDDIVSGKGILKETVYNDLTEEHIEIRDCQRFYSQLGGVPIKETDLSQIFDGASKTYIEQLKEQSGEITVVLFPSQLDRELDRAAWELLRFNGETREPISDVEIDELAAQTYDRLVMLLAES